MKAISVTTRIAVSLAALSVSLVLAAHLLGMLPSERRAVLRGRSALCESLAVNFSLLADEDGSVAKAFGVPTKAGGSISRTVNGEKHELVRGVTSSRWTFVIDKNGKVVHRSDKVNAAKDSEAVLAVLKGLAK